jgi:monofunctional biosynthetic peptidoglycan transglycosylase
MPCHMFGRRRDKPSSPPRSRFRRRFFRAVRWCVYIIAGFYVFCLLGLLYVRFFDPPFTAVQAERRVESWFSDRPYVKRYQPVKLARVPLEVQRAVIAAEDGRFYEHHGIDWEELDKVAKESWKRKTVIRGGSTITQQLVKNLFLTTWRSPVRKVLEFTLTPLAELVLSKQRILELYLNVIEWGPGVYGIEAASRYHYHVSVGALSRDQAARLAAIIPDPRRRKPARMDHYAATILNRMNSRGW